MIVRKVGLSILLIATLLRPAASLLAAEMATVAQPPSLCRAEEQIIFTCVAAGSAKFASLCGSRLLDHRRGYLQYRYGNPGAIELQFPRHAPTHNLLFATPITSGPRWIAPKSASTTRILATSSSIITTVT
ncbi:MAG: hypothetical protein ACXW6J_07640 [Candidatus Binatia bacterium]